jgi:hypothetical protein
MMLSFVLVSVVHRPQAAEPEASRAPLDLEAPVLEGSGEQV